MQVQFTLKFILDSTLYIILYIYVTHSVDLVRVTDKYENDSQNIDADDRHTANQFWE